jgi:hypothetical protein
MLQTALLDASVDPVEIVLGHQERIVLRADLLASGDQRVVEAGAMVESYRQEVTEFLGAW